MRPSRRMLGASLVAALGAAQPMRARSLRAPTYAFSALGFLPDGAKHATLGATRSCGGRFNVLHALTGAIAFTGTTRSFANASSSCLLDFTPLSTPGTYRLALPGTPSHSAAFAIGEDVLNAPFQMAMVGFFLSRCGQDVPPLAPSDGLVVAAPDGRPYGHRECHAADGLVDARHTGERHEAHIDGSGGWHDGASYGKYSVNTGFTLGVLMYAWEHFAERLACARVGLPARVSARAHAPPLPDFLHEVRWGMAWLLKMQRSDGTVHHMLAPSQLDAFSRLPDDDPNARYFSAWGTTATATLAAAGAQAARVFQKHDGAFARDCLRAARFAYAALLAHPEPKLPDLSAFGTRLYLARDPHWDEGVRLWAAAELYETTGERCFLNDAERLLAAFDAPARTCAHLRAAHSDWRRCKVSDQLDWDDQRNLGAVRYLTLTRASGRSGALYEQTKQQLAAVADAFASNGLADAHGDTLGGLTKWGVNGERARQALVLHSAELVLGANATLAWTALDTLGSLLGRNSFGRSFVTKLGHAPPAHPHHRPSMVFADAWPGFLVGGPNRGGGPKAWIDNWLAFRSNEVAINWNAGLAYASARYYICPTPAPAQRGRARPRGVHEDKTTGAPIRTQAPPLSALGTYAHLPDEQMSWLGSSSAIRACRREQVKLTGELLAAMAADLDATRGNRPPKPSVHIASHRGRARLPVIVRAAPGDELTQFSSQR